MRYCFSLAVIARFIAQERRRIYCQLIVKGKGKVKLVNLLFFKGFPYILMYFFYIHLGYSLYFIVVCLCHIKGGVPPPSGGIVGKNRSTRNIRVNRTVQSSEVESCILQDIAFKILLIVHQYNLIFFDNTVDNVI